VSFSRRAASFDLARRAGARFIPEESSGRYSTRLTLPTTNLRAAFDARTLPNADVALWNDVRGGGSIYAAQGTGSLQPSYEASVASLNGQPAAVFGSDDYLTISGIGVSAAAGFSIYWVADVVSINPGNACTVFFAGQTRAYIANSNSLTWPSIYLDTSRTLGYAGDTRTGPVCHTWTTGLTPRAYVNRVMTGEASVPSQKGLTGAITLGTASPNNAPAKVAAFFIYDGIHNETQRDEVWDYIYQEWRVSPRLNAGFGTPIAYDTVILAGQSNARGTALLSMLASPYETPYPGVRLYDSTPFYHRSREWGDLGPVTSSANYGYGCELSLGRDLDADAGWPNVAIYKCAEGSTSLTSDWAPATVGQNWDELTDVYARAVACLPNAGDSLNVRAFIWIQGESDTVVEAHSLAYEANLTAFIAAVRAEFGAGLPFWIVRLTTPNPFGAYEANVIAAQNAVAAADGKVHIVAPPSPLQGDGVHFTAAGLVAIGQTLAASIIAEGA